MQKEGMVAMAVPVSVGAGEIVMEDLMVKTSLTFNISIILNVVL